MQGFVHLHNHSDYSMLDGAGTIDGYIARCKELGMDALAITDHGNMHGTVAFYKACRKAGIKPIVGCEFYHTRNRASRDQDNKYDHLVLLAMDNDGYHELMKLNAMAWTEGFWYKARIDDKALAEHSSHLVCLSGCVSGEIPRLLLRGESEAARNRCLWYKGLFGDRYFIEIQDHGLPAERRAVPLLVSLARELDIPIVCTNDCHYINKEDWDAHDTLLCIGTQSLKTDTERMRYVPGEFCLKSEGEMRRIFSDYPEAADNTLRVASMCNLEIEFPGPVLPRFEIPAGFSSDSEYLASLARAGLRKRYPDAGAEKRKALSERLEHELGIIEKMDFPSYFLIVQDYINWAKGQGIPVGPGRGSGAGSLVAYSLGITDVDPMKYSLLFERFLNPERVSLPDFDVDFCFERRTEVIRYVSERYGADHVGQIATFSQEKPKQVMKDVARVFGLSIQESNAITALIPDEIPGKKHWGVSDAVEAVPELKAMMASSPTMTKVFQHAARLSGLNRHTSLHAAGVVIGRETLDEYVPLMTDKNGAVASQYTMLEIEECGLVKMDFLGLKTLTLIKNAVDLIRLREPGFDIEKIPEDDKAVFKMLQKGDSSCVFQFESGGMQNVLRQALPDSIEDLVALNALYRPGPMQFIDRFARAKRGLEPIEYPDTCLEDILKTTYGVIVYQEQVMQVAQRIAGYTLGEADMLRRIMGKKKADKMAEELEKFKAGAVRNGFSAKHAEEIFHILEPFAGYGFNKSHAVAYTIIAYRTAYLKAHYPAEFMAANLTNEMGNPDKFREYLSLASSWGLRVAPPSINRSGRQFSVDGDTIVYGLEGIKNVSASSAEAIMKERDKGGEFKDFIDFISRMPEQLGIKVSESLVKAGCFDSLGDNRNTILFSLKDIYAWDKTAKKQAESGQASLFDAFEDDIRRFDMPEKEPMGLLEQLRMEKDMLGLYISGHPVDTCKDAVESCVCVDLSDPSTIRIGQSTQIVAELSSIRTTFTKKNGTPMAIVALSTAEGTIETVLMGDSYDRLRSFQEGSIVAVRGKFVEDSRNGGMRFFCEEFGGIDILRAKAVAILHVRLSSSSSRRDALNLVSAIERIKAEEGIRVMVSSEDDIWSEVLLDKRIDPNRMDIESIRSLPGVRKAWTE